MKNNITAGLLVVAVTAAYWVVQAGNLEPPGPPAPTMVTLSEIGSSGRVHTTGQSACWDLTGTPIACLGTGQDGEYQKGVSVAPRFTDNADGTVTDNLTSLIWLKDANCFGLKIWPTALSSANTLANGSCGLADGSVAGDWRLPNIKELQSLYDYNEINPAVPAGHPFAGVRSDKYWSSTTHVGDPSLAWTVLPQFSGSVNYDTKADDAFVWPVRGGN